MPQAQDTAVRADRHSRRKSAHLTEATNGSSRQREADWVDVWTRTEPRYRRRSVLLLLINGALFFGLCSFTYWLRSSLPLPFLSPEYWANFWRSFSPLGEHQATLLDFVLYPIDVHQAPMQIIVLGLLLASLISIPILVSMLYRLPFALPFVLMVGFVAMMPWLALTLLLSCWLTTLRLLRFSFRFATAMIALLPVVVYFVNATRNPAAAAAYSTPIESTLLYAPWALAFLSCCLLMGLVLLIARIVGYRPGAIAPLLALMFAAPVVLFEAKVGRDELAYRLLEREFGPNSPTYFHDVDAATVLRRLALERQAEQGTNARPIEAIMEELKSIWWYQLDPVEVSDEADKALNLFELYQYRAVTACDDFLADFPRSRYLPNVLYLKGRALDMRIDLEAFRSEAVLRYYSDFPSHNSASTWATLTEQYPNSPVTSVAMLRLAELEARQGKVGQALKRLDTLEERFGGAEASSTRPTAGMLSRLQKSPPTHTLAIRVRDIVHEARKFRDLLRSNRDPHLAIPPDIPADAPLVEFLRCDPRHARYRQNLREIAARYPLSSMQPRLELEAILTQRSQSLKIDALERFIERHQSNVQIAALPEAMYELGRAYLRDSRLRDASTVFARLVESRPDSPWADDAQRELARLASVETLGAAG